MIKTLLKVFIMSFVFVLFFIAPADAALRITPNKFEFTVDKKSKRNVITGAFTVQAGAGERIRFKVYPNYFILDDRGLIQTLPSEEKENSLMERIRFMPKEFTLNPDRPQKVRFTITDVQELPDGESRVVLFLEDKKTKKQAMPTNGKFSAYINIKTRVAIKIYVDKGEIKKIGEIEELTIDHDKDQNPLYKIKLNSTGNSRVAVNGKGYITKEGELVKEFPIIGKDVMGGSSGYLVDKIPTEDLIPEIDYTLKTILTYKDGDQQAQSLITETLFKMEKIITGNDINKVGIEPAE